MKIRLSLLSAILGLALGPVAFAENAPKGPPAGEKEPETVMGGKMEKVNGAWRRVRGQVADASKNEDTLKQIGIIKENLGEALKLEPAKKDDIPPAEQAKFVADFQAKLKEFIGEVDKLEALVKAGKNEEAAAQVKNLGDLQKQDHNSFKKKQPKKS